MSAKFPNLCPSLPFLSISLSVLLLLLFALASESRLFSVAVAAGKTSPLFALPRSLVNLKLKTKLQSDRQGMLVFETRTLNTILNCCQLDFKLNWV
jgi:hypothetical protein